MLDPEPEMINRSAKLREYIHNVKQMHKQNTILIKINERQLIRREM